MYRSCGQLIDPYGSQGEQLQRTNYAQRGREIAIEKLRGDYNETWTVFLDYRSFPDGSGQIHGARRPSVGVSGVEDGGLRDRRSVRRCPTRASVTLSEDVL